MQQPSKFSQQKIKSPHPIKKKIYYIHRSHHISHHFLVEKKTINNKYEKSKKLPL